MPNSFASGPTLIFLMATREEGLVTRWAEKTSAYWPEPILGPLTYFFRSRVSRWSARSGIVVVVFVDVGAGLVLRRLAGGSGGTSRAGDVMTAMMS